MADAKTGITINFRGNTVQFDDSIDGINKSLRLLGLKAKEVNEQFKFDDSGSWEKRNELISINKDRIERLKQEIKYYQDELEKLSKISQQNGKLTNSQMNEFTNMARALSSCEKELNNLIKANEKLENTNPTWQAWTKSIEQLEKDLNSLGDNLEKVGKKFAALSAAATGALTLGVKYNAEMEQYTIALTTALGSEEKALETINKIKEDATKTPWGVKELTEYNRTLIATGLSAEESEEIILSLGDAVSAVGGTSDVFSRMVQNLQQIKNAGNATAMDIRQFAYAGIDIYGILSDYLGKTTAEITEQDRTWENIIGAFKKASSEGGKYYGAMINQSESLTAQLSKLKDEVSQAMGEITESLMPAIKKVVSKLKEWATALKNLSPEQQEMIANILTLTALISPILLGAGKIVKMCSSLMGGISKVTKALSGITSISKFLSGITFTLSSALPLAMAAAGVGLVSLMTIALNSKGSLQELKEEMQSLSDEADSNFSQSLITLAEEQTNVNNCITEIKKNLSDLDYNPDGTIDKTSDSYNNLASKIEEYHSYIGDSDTSVDEEINKLLNNVDAADQLAESYKNVAVEKERSAWIEAHQEEYDNALSLRYEALSEMTRLESEIESTLENAIASNNSLDSEKLREYANTLFDTDSSLAEQSEAAQYLVGNVDSLTDSVIDYRYNLSELNTTQQTLDDYTKVLNADSETLHTTLLAIDGDTYEASITLNQDDLNSIYENIDYYTQYLHKLQSDTTQYGVDNQAEIERVSNILSELWQEAALKAETKKTLTDDDTTATDENTEAVNENKDANVMWRDVIKESQDALAETKTATDDATSSVDILTERINQLPTMKKVTIEVETKYTSSGSASKYTSSYGFGNGGSGGFDGGLATLLNLREAINNLRVPNYSLDNYSRNEKIASKLLKTPKLASGGFNAGGFNFTLNVNNNGNPISSNSVKKWADILTDRINENLGREM